MGLTLYPGSPGSPLSPLSPGGPWWNMKCMSKLQKDLTSVVIHSRKRVVSKSGVTYYVTWRTRRTLYFPIIPLLALQMKTRTVENSDVLYKAQIPDVSVHCCFWPKDALTWLNTTCYIRYLTISQCVYNLLTLHLCQVKAMMYLQHVVFDEGAEVSDLPKQGWSVQAAYRERCIFFHKHLLFLIHSKLICGQSKLYEHTVSGFCWDVLGTDWGSELRKSNKMPVLHIKRKRCTFSPFGPGDPMGPCGPWWPCKDRHKKLLFGLTTPNTNNHNSLMSIHI